MTHNPEKCRAGELDGFQGAVSPCTCPPQKPNEDWRVRWRQWGKEKFLSDDAIAMATEWFAYELSLAEAKRDAFWQNQEMGKSSDCAQHEASAEAKGHQRAVEEMRATILGLLTLTEKP